MTILGNSGTPSSGAFFDDTGNSQFWTAFTMPTGGGTLNECHVYVGGDGVSATGQLVVWQGSSIAWQSGSLTLPSGSRSTGGQGWVVRTGLSVALTAGPIAIGFWSSGDVAWSWEGSGHVNYQRSVSSPGALASAGTEGSGALGAYIVYTPAGGGAGSIYAYDGATEQVLSDLYCWDGAAWQNVTSGGITGLYCWDGSAWQQLW